MTEEGLLKKRIFEVLLRERPLLPISIPNSKIEQILEDAKKEFPMKPWQGTTILRLEKQLNDGSNTQAEKRSIETMIWYLRWLGS